jgi:hypothetical protein
VKDTKGRSVSQKTQVAAIRRISVPQLGRAIQRLNADEPVEVPGVWYLTQKEHGRGWLKYYNTEGAYGRVPGMNRDARYAYNHVVNPRMLEWLARGRREA